MSAHTGERSRTRKRSFTWEVPAATAAVGLELTGLEYMQRIAVGTIPPPPIAQLLAFAIAEAETLTPLD